MAKGTFHCRYYRYHTPQATSSKSQSLKTNVLIINHVQFSFLTGKDKQFFLRRVWVARDLCLMAIGKCRQMYAKIPTDSQSKHTFLWWVLGNKTAIQIFLCFLLLFTAAFSFLFQFLQTVNVDNNASCIYIKHWDPQKKDTAQKPIHKSFQIICRSNIFKYYCTFFNEKKYAMCRNEKWYSNTQTQLPGLSTAQRVKDVLTPAGVKSVITGMQLEA